MYLIFFREAEGSWTRVSTHAKRNTSELDLPRQPSTGGNPLVLLRLLVHRSGLCTDSAEGTKWPCFAGHGSGNDMLMEGGITRLQDVIVMT